MAKLSELHLCWRCWVGLGWILAGGPQTYCQRKLAFKYENYETLMKQKVVFALTPIRIPWVPQLEEVTENGFIHSLWIIQVARPVFATPNSVLGHSTVILILLWFYFVPTDGASYTASASYKIKSLVKFFNGQVLFSTWINCVAFMQKRL